MDIELTVKIKHRLKILMAEVGCRSIATLSSETGIHVNTLYALEKETRMNLSLENVAKLLWFFDCSFEELFQIEVASNEPSHYDDLADDVKEAISEGEKEFPKEDNLISA